MADGEYLYCKALILIFRITALGLSIAAAILMATASEVVIVDDGTKPSSYSVSYSHYNPLRYFVAAGVISALCSAAALFLFVVRVFPMFVSLALVSFLDAATQGFLFSAAGATIAAMPRDVVGGSVCHAAGAFCSRVTIAAALSALAAICVAVVVALAGDVGRSCSGGRRWSASPYCSACSG